MKDFGPSLQADDEITALPLRAKAHAKNIENQTDWRDLHW
jgi:hypothetical protein